MKTKYFPIAAISFVMALSACSEVDPVGEQEAANSQLSVSSSQLSFGLNRKETVDVMATEGLGWEAHSSQSWISISNGNGVGSRTMTISVVEDNPSTQKRSGTISLKSKRFNRSATINVEQEGTYLRTGKNEVDFSTKGGQESVTVESNATWTIAHKPSWVSVQKPENSIGAATIVLTVSTNPNGEDRVDSLVLQNAATSKSVKIVQSKVALTVSGTSLSFEQGSGQSKTISVTSNVEWKVRSSESWCTVIPQYGDGNGTFTVSVSANTKSTTRTAYIYVESGNVTRTITVSQKGVELTVKPTSLTFDEKAGSQTVTVTSNVTWTASSDKTWCTVSKDSNKMTVKVEANSSTSSRSATITVKAGDATQKVEVTQTGKGGISLISTTFSAGDDWWSMTVSTSSTQSWTASADRSWVHFSADNNNATKQSTYSGKGPSKIRVHVDANPYFTARSATVTVKFGTESAKVTITQNGLTNLVLKDLLTYPLGNVYVSLKTGSYSSMLSKLQELYYVYTNTSTDYYLSVSVAWTQNAILKNLTYQGVPFHSFSFSYDPSSSIIRAIYYNFEIEKSKLSDPIPTFTKIKSDLESIAGTTLKNVSSTSTDVQREAEVLKNNTTYRITLYNNADSGKKWRYQITLYYWK